MKIELTRELTMLMDSLQPAGPREISAQHSLRIFNALRDSFEAVLAADDALRRLAYNRRSDGTLTCWCSSSDKPDRDHSPACNRARFVLEGRRS